MKWPVARRLFGPFPPAKAKGKQKHKAELGRLPQREKRRRGNRRHIERRGNQQDGALSVADSRRKFRRTSCCRPR